MAPPRVSSVPPDLRPKPTVKAKPVAKKPTVKPKPKPKAAVDPYANPEKYINQAVGRLGNPLTDAAIQAQAQGQLSPLIQALTASIGRQAQAGTAAIGGYTSELAKSLGGFQQNAATIYGGAQASQAASDAALSAKLSGGGAQQAQDLGARLQSINAPGATNAAVQDATQTATGSGNALYATGSASLADLIASGAAEQSYAGKLPGIARLAGLQQTGSLQSQLAGKLADETGTLQAKAPEIVSGLQSQRSDLLNRRAQLRQDLGQFFSDRELKQAALAQEQQAFGLKAATANTSAQQAQQRIGISQQNANTSAQRLAVSARNSDRNYQLGLKRIGISDKNLQLRALGVAKKEKKGGFTPSQLQAFQGKAYTIADDSAHGYTVTQNGVPTKVAAVNAKQAMRRMLRAGIPPDVAHAALSQFYKQTKPILIYGPTAAQAGR